MTVVQPEVEDLTDLIPYEESKDADRKTHIVNPPNNLHIWKPGMEAQDIVDIARISGLEVVALCGYRWVPKHNPDKFPVCDPCMVAAGDIMSGLGE